MARNEFNGIPVSQGIAVGTLEVMHHPQQYISHASSQNEKEKLTEAIQKSIEDLQTLSQRNEDSAIMTIMDIQIHMLQDPALLDPIFAKITDGVSALAVWEKQLDSDIQKFSSSDDHYFSARASDILDIKLRVMRRLTRTSRVAYSGNTILVADDLLPSDFLEIPWQTGGLILRRGSMYGHLAVLAKSKGVPLVIGVSDFPHINEGSVIVDANQGIIIVEPSNEEQAHYTSLFQANESFQKHERYDWETLNRTIEVNLNVADPNDLKKYNVDLLDGIGLVRTEFTLHSVDNFYDEQKQYAAYRKILNWASGKPVIFRLLDIGGDKPIHGLTYKEDNPFLGIRGVRFLLRQRSLLEIQLRALLRASVHGNLKIMVPMVTIPEELEAVRSIMKEIINSLNEQSNFYTMPPLGIMIEVPSAALLAEQFDADFFSIGTNDLLQFTTACSRNSRELNVISQPSNPAFLQLLAHIIQVAKKKHIAVGICGDMASEVKYVKELLDRGITAFSVNYKAINKIRFEIARTLG